ncbi:MAG TPA: EAL domain-containing response regulator [Kofleriaceae bacterium]|nr:EAL domain-containing response regulator [Kofleriaceae bacterium]
MQPTTIEPHLVGPPGNRGSVLLLDDDVAVLRSYARVLERAGFSVVRRSSAADVARLLGQAAFDAVVSDIAMPGMDGTEVLRMVREREPDLPVILITGFGDLRSAAKAVELKAMRYLFKPVEVAVLIATVDDAVQEHENAVDNRRTLERVGRAATEQRELGAQFARALGKLELVHQPIVRWQNRTVFAHEALVRSREPGLIRPLPLFAAAERLGRLPDLGRAIRRASADRVRRSPAGTCAFVNVHPFDLFDEDLYSQSAPLSSVAEQIVLEITECASLEAADDLPERLERLRRMGYRIALDDLGAGYAGLSALAHLAPHTVKLDMSLTRSIETDTTKQKLIASLIHVCRQLDILVVGEGVEVPAQRDVLVELGCDLLQGYLFAAPAAEFPVVAW